MTLRTALLALAALTSSTTNAYSQASIQTVMSASSQQQPRNRQPMSRTGFLKVSAAAVLGGVAAAAPLPANAFNSYGVQGTYTDPIHPEGYRQVKIFSATKAVVDGSDSGKTKEWSLPATVSGDTVSIDFTNKGYAAIVEAKFDGTGLTFPDGNKWPKADNFSKGKIEK
eukprot:CAMPEP_0171654072 /NCGR_PEP_ID=MMETSP0990-20121206/39970_1 /TAXON_ID=483369 /ORGANISM="non described non described, Strain CCMP2098" /LENGTH=168 /DNA_ID=CAMNT_0012233689 /DNA_START=105 /DNA_END=611 /DNA_ORIENTATION=-